MNLTPSIRFGSAICCVWPKLYLTSSHPLHLLMVGSPSRLLGRKSGLPGTLAWRGSVARSSPEDVSFSRVIGNLVLNCYTFGRFAPMKKINFK